MTAEPLKEDADDIGKVLDACRSSGPEGFGVSGVHQMLQSAYAAAMTGNELISLGSLQHAVNRCHTKTKNYVALAKQHVQAAENYMRAQQAIEELIVKIRRRRKDAGLPDPPPA